MILELIKPYIKDPFLGLLLYGSYARRDAEHVSDVDILQITSVHTRPYSYSNVNFTCYTPNQLLTLCNKGDLFARHLTEEAVPLIDPKNFLQKMRSAYVPPRNYAPVLREVKAAAPLVAVNEEMFEARRDQYCSTASYLLRTHVYATAFDSGFSTFSMRQLASATGDRRPYECLVKLREEKCFFRFQRVVNLLFELTKTPMIQRQEPLDVFTLNVYGAYDLAVVLGLRLLAGGEPITYVLDSLNL